jgi:hypothetical protein
MIRILSFGAGVQSTAVLRMSLDGELPWLDHVIFADPGSELAATYEHVDLMESICCHRGVGFHRVKTHRKGSSGTLIGDMMRASTMRELSSPPLYIRHPDGAKGQLNRQCTSDYKTDAINRKFKALCGIKPGAHGPKEPIAEQWLGIHGGEKVRMKTAAFRWYRILHPLIEHAPGQFRDRPIDNGDCVAWLQARGYPVPPKSACKFCPYQSDRRWVSMPSDEQEECIELDEHLREMGDDLIAGDIYLHRSCKPLRQVIAEMDRQGALDIDGFSDECSGVCGV